MKSNRLRLLLIRGLIFCWLIIANPLLAQDISDNINSGLINPVPAARDFFGTPINISNLINTNSCQGQKESSSLYFVGQGGIPYNPFNLLDSHNVWEDIRPAIPEELSHQTPKDLIHSKSPIKTFSQDSTEQYHASKYLLNQGITLYESGHFESAVFAWEQALVEVISQNESLEQALLLSNLSQAYQQLEQWGAAAKAVHESVDLLVQIQNSIDYPSTVYWEYYAKAHNAEGLLLWHHGKINEAQEAWQKATIAYRKAEYFPGIVISTVNQTTALEFLGFKIRALTILSSIQQEVQAENNIFLQVIVQQSLGNSLRYTGNWAQSIASLTHALEDTSELSLSNFKKNAIRSSIFLNLGNTDFQAYQTEKTINNLETAQIRFSQAYQWYEQAKATNESGVIGIKAEVNTLALLVDNRQWNDAIEKSQSLLSKLNLLPQEQSAVFIRLNYANTLMKVVLAMPQDLLPQAPSFSKIIPHFSQAIQQARQLQNPRLESYGLGKLGSVYEQTHHWTEAKALTERALLAIEGIQAPEIKYEWEWQMGRIFAQQIGIINLTVAPLLRNNFEADEQKDLFQKAISFYRQAVIDVDQVRRDLLVLDSDIQFSFRDAIEPIYRQYVDLLLHPTQVSPQTLETSVQLIESLQVAELENVLRCDSLSSLKLSEVNVSSDTVVIYFIQLDDRLEIVLAIPNQPLKRSRVSVTRVEIESLISALQHSLPVSSRRRQAQRLSNQLYQWLIQPWEEELKIDETIESSAIKTLIFVLNGNLGNIPMAALWDQERQRYLLERYATAVIPSLKLLDPKPLNRPIKVLATGSTESLRHPFSGRVLAPLQNVQNELEGISNHTPTEILLDGNSTRSNLEEILSKDEFDVLHFATHGQFSSDPNRTFLLLNDTPLYSADLDELLRLNAYVQAPIDMIVLSACQTASGDNRAVLGLAGLTISAGARSALASLWEVDDLSASLLMQEFYKQLATHPDISRAEALRRSQLFVLSNKDFQKDFQSPRFWAPYILVGDWS